MGKTKDKAAKEAKKEKKEKKSSKERTVEAAAATETKKKRKVRAMREDDGRERTRLRREMKASRVETDRWRMFAMQASDEEDESREKSRAREERRTSGRREISNSGRPNRRRRIRWRWIIFRV